MPILALFLYVNDTNFNSKTPGISHMVAGLSSNVIDSLIGLPGASYNSDSSEIILPESTL